MDRTLIVLTMVCLAGCATPLPIAEFDPPDKAGGRHFNKYADRSLPYGSVKTFGEVQTAMRAYRHLYLEEADKKRLQAQSASEVSFFSSVLGVLGGVARSQDAALTGGGIAAGAGLYSDRYKLIVQAANYEKAAEALECMYLLLPDGVSEHLGAFRVKSENASAESVFRTAALESLLFVRSKLRTLQSTFQFGDADVNKLKDALTKKSDDVEEGQDKLGVTRAKQASIDSDALKSYRKDLKACEAKYSG